MRDFEEIEDMKLRVAAKMGWENIAYSRDGFLNGHPPGRRDVRAIPQYVTNMNSTWEIVSLLTRLQITISIQNESVKGYVRLYRVIMGQGKEQLANQTDEIGSFAVCKAFLELPNSVFTAAKIHRVGKTNKSNDEVGPQKRCVIAAKQSP